MNLGWSTNGKEFKPRGPLKTTKGIAEIPLAPNNTPTGTPTLTGEFKVGQTINLDASE